MTVIYSQQDNNDIIDHIPLLEAENEAQDEDVKPQTTDWRGIYLTGVCSAIQSIQFTIFFSSLWPYLKTLKPDIHESFLGYIISFYSLAQLIAAPAFGYWSNKIEQVKFPMLIGFTLMALGNIVYILLQLFPLGIIPYMMIISRLISGLGSGNGTLLRAYAAIASTSEDRSRAIACFTGGKAVGTLMGPALQLIFIPLGENGIILFGLQINTYNAPALFGIFLNIIGLIITRYYFVENVLVDDKCKKRGNGSSGIDYVPLLVCIVTRFTQIYVQTTIETIGAPYTMLMFSQTKVESVFWNSSAHSLAGCVAAAMYIYFIFRQIPKFLRGQIPIILSVVTVLLGYLLTYPFEFNPSVQLINNNRSVGCDLNKFDWCKDLTSTNKWAYYSFYVIIFGVVITVLNITMTTLYSKLVGKGRQGTWQGLYQMSGSGGRLAAPLLASNLFTAYGPRSVWSTIILDCALVTVLWVVFYRRMVPLDERVKTRRLV